MQLTGVNFVAWPESVMFILRPTDPHAPTAAAIACDADAQIDLSMEDDALQIVDLANQMNNGVWELGVYSGKVWYAGKQDELSASGTTVVKAANNPCFGDAASEGSYMYMKPDGVRCWHVRNVSKALDVIVGRLVRSWTGQTSLKVSGSTLIWA